MKVNWRKVDAAACLVIAALGLAMNVWLAQFSARMLWRGVHHPFYFMAIAFCLIAAVWVVKTAHMFWHIFRGTGIVVDPRDNWSEGDGEGI